MSSYLRFVLLLTILLGAIGAQAPTGVNLQPNTTHQVWTAPDGGDGGSGPHTDTGGNATSGSGNWYDYDGAGDPNAQYTGVGWGNGRYVVGNWQPGQQAIVYVFQEFGPYGCRKWKKYLVKVAPNGTLSEDPDDWTDTGKCGVFCTSPRPN